jgi:ABC-2 type transport system permease protein
MTSKRLFLNLIRQDQRIRLWLASILTILDFLLLPVVYLMQMDYQARGLRLTAEELATARMSTTEAFFAAEPWMILVGICAVVAAVTGFSWLCSQKKIDYYHAMPIKREGIFFAFFTDGWMMGTLPFAAAELIAFYAVGGIYRQVTRSTAVLFWKSFLMLILFYLAVYAITVLAMVMTGRIVIGVLLAVMIEVYVPLCVFLYGALMGTFSTYWSENISWSSVRWTSPLLVAAMGGENRTALSAIVLVLYAAAAVMAGVLVYRRRPSETAGSAYVHPRIASVIKTMVSIPAGLVFACFFYFIWNPSNGGAGWAIVWALIGAVLADIVMELIQHLDPAAILKGWRSAAVIIGSTAVVMVLVVLKPFDYDQYIPAQSKISAMGFACDEVNEVLLPDSSYTGYAVNQKLMVSQTMTSDFSEIYQLAEEGKKYAGRDEDPADGEEDSVNYSSVVIAYKKKTGGLVYRSYEIPKDAVKTTLARLSKNEAFRENVYSANHMNPSEFNQIDILNWSNYQPDDQAVSVNLTADDAVKLVNALRKDMNRVEIGTVLDTEPVLSVSFQRYSRDEQGYDVPDISGVYIYPQYENTLAFLREKGYDPGNAMTAGEIADTLSSVQIMYYSGEGEDDQSVTLTDRDSIANLFQSVERVRSDQADSNVTVIMTDRKGSACYPDVRIKDETAFKEVTGFTE